MSLASFFLGIACSADIRLFLNADKCCDEEGNVQKDINNAWLINPYYNNLVNTCRPTCKDIDVPLHLNDCERVLLVYTL